MHSSAVTVSIFGLLAAISWGFSNFLSAKASRTLGPIVSSLAVNTIGTVLYTVCYFLVLRTSVHMSTVAFCYAAASGIVFAAGASTFFKGLQAGPVTIVAPLSGIYPLATLAVGLLVFHASITFVELTGIALVIIGALAAAELIGARRQVDSGKLGSGPAWAFMTALGWGSSYALLAQSIARVGWQSASLIELIFVIIGFAVLMPFIKGDERVSAKILWNMTCNKFVASAGVIQLVGMLALNVGLAKEGGSGAVVTAISSCCPVITMLLALRHLEERIKLVPLLGACGTIAGVVVLSF